MKSIRYVSWVLAMGLLTPNILLADGVANQTTISNQQFIGQRPFQQAPVDNKPYKSDDAWVGATMVTDEAPTEAVNTKQDKNTQLRLHFLGKRPYGDVGRVD